MYITQAKIFENFRDLVESLNFKTGRQNGYYIGL